MPCSKPIEAVGTSSSLQCSLLLGCRGWLRFVSEKFVCRFVICKMVGYSHPPFICSQDEDYVGSENFSQHPSQFPTSAFKSYTPNPSSTCKKLYSRVGIV